MNRYNVATIYKKIVDSFNNLHKTLTRQERLGHVQSKDNYLLLFRNHGFMERLQSLFTPPTLIWTTQSGGKLFLGNCINAGDRHFMSEAMVSLVVNASKEVPNHFESDKGIKYIQVQAHDVGEDSDQIIVPEVARNVAKELNTGGVVFCHCFMGRSRSVSVCIQALKLISNMSVIELYLHIKKKRNIVHINQQFYEKINEHFMLLAKKDS